MFLFKYKCKNCKYNISLRVNFYYRLTFLLNLKNPVNTFVRYFMHIFFSSPLWALLFSSSKLLQTTSQSLNTVYQFDFSVLFFSPCSYTCLLLHRLSSIMSSRHIFINVSRSKCEYFVFSVFDTETCTFHEMYIVALMGWMDGWMDGVYSLFLPHERCIYYVSLFEQLVQHVFWNRGISLHIEPVVAVYTVRCMTPFFLKKSSLKRDLQHTHYVQ